MEELLLSKLLPSCDWLPAGGRGEDIVASQFSDLLHEPLLLCNGHGLVLLTDLFPAILYVIR